MSEGESAASSVKEAFQGKRGKILILVGAGLAVYLYWTRGRTGTAEPVPGEELGEPVAGTGRVPQTDPIVGNDEQGTVTPRRPLTQDEWLSSGVDVLVGRGVPGGDASSALTKALAGDQLTAQQVAWVNQVISALGSPPGGMPPLNSAPPTTPTTPAPGTGARYVNVAKGFRWNTFITYLRSKGYPKSITFASIYLLNPFWLAGHVRNGVVTVPGRVRVQ